MDSTERDERVRMLQQQVADITFPSDLFDHLRKLVTATLHKFDEIDPFILNLDAQRVAQLQDLLSHAEKRGEITVCHLSHLDMFDLERMSLTAENYHRDLGGDAILGLDPAGVKQLTESIGQQRRDNFSKKTDTPNRRQSTI